MPKKDLKKDALQKNNADKKSLDLYFNFFNEIGIIEQLSRAHLEAHLPDGFLISHFSVLNHLVRVQDGQTPLFLAQAFQVPKTTMTHTLSILERHKLIEFQPNPKDKRSKCVHITEAGQTFRQQAIENLVPYLKDMSKVFSEKHIVDLTAGLADIRKFLDDYRNE